MSKDSTFKFNQFFLKCELWRKVESGTKNIGESVKIYWFFFFFWKIKRPCINYSNGGYNIKAYFMYVICAYFDYKDLCLSS